ncbi:MAG TPA: phosphoribosylglycinamide formyltransferase [Polyangia bacterium]
MKIGILASGGGTNLQALIDAGARGDLGPGRIVVVGTNVPGCGALERAAQANIPTFVRSHKDFASREEFDQVLLDEMRRHGVGLVVLAGFMRLLTPHFLDTFPHRVVNIHPALLPSFPGVHAQKQAFLGGVRFTGCTVHFVDAGTDTGPIIAQAVVPVLESDDEESLRLRILAEEHRLFPAVIRAIAEGRVSVDDRSVKVRGIPAGLADARLRSL